MTVELLPKGLDPAKFKCYLHLRHVPVPRVLQNHHTIPQSWTAFLGLPDSKRVPLDGTSHDSVHVAIRRWIHDGKPPFPLPGLMRSLVEDAVNFWFANPKLAENPHLLQTHDLQ